MNKVYIFASGWSFAFAMNLLGRSDFVPAAIYTGLGIVCILLALKDRN